MESLTFDEDVQFEWALKEYLTEAPFPLVADFVQWADDCEAPDPVICKAFMNGNEQVVEMAQELHTLQQAWFPTEHTKKRIKLLEGSLTYAL